MVPGESRRGRVVTAGFEGVLIKGWRVEPEFIAMHSGQLEYNQPVLGTLQVMPQSENPTVRCLDVDLRRYKLLRFTAHERGREIDLQPGRTRFLMAHDEATRDVAQRVADYAFCHGQTIETLGRDAIRHACGVETRAAGAQLSIEQALRQHHDAGLMTQAFVSGFLSRMMEIQAHAPHPGAPVSALLPTVPEREDDVVERSADAIDHHVTADVKPATRKESFDNFMKRSTELIEEATRNHKGPNE